MHDSQGTVFLGEIGVILIAAFVGGLAAQALRLPVLIGYLLAGIAVGPHTPGFIADEHTVRIVADLGITLLMFAVGVQFSLEELHHVRKTALIVGGALLAGSIGLGLLLAWAFGWGAFGGLFLGCALFLSSTAVMMRILDERGELGTSHGGIILGVLVVQDLSFVLMVVLLPALATVGTQGTAAFGTVLIALLKAGAFLAITLLLATKLVPAFLDRLTRTGSRELFLLAVVCLCLATAFAAEKMGLGVALGAFLAGIVIAESPYAHEVFAQVRPLRDVFSSLFFVSVGMLLDPAYVAANWGLIVSVSLAIIIGKPLVTFLAMHWSGHPVRTSLLVSLGLAQIGEFSFLLASAGGPEGSLSPDVGRVILSSALISLLLAPFIYRSAAPLYRWINRVPLLHDWLITKQRRKDTAGDAHPPEDRRPGHVIILGYGRVGRYVSDALRARDMPHTVVDYDTAVLSRLEGTSVPVLFGDVTAESVLRQTRPQKARLAVVALPETVTSEMAVRLLKQLAPELPVLVRLHRGVDIPRIRAAGADAVIHAEFEAATEIIRQGLHRLDVSDDEIDTYLEFVRQRRYRHEEEPV